MKRWARHFDDCQFCHRTDVEHVAKGLCARCYSAAYAAENSERVAEQKHEWYVRAGAKEWAKIQREQRNYSGLRDAVLERDGHRCVVCGDVVGLVVHHKDGQGRGTKTPNNKMSNLETRCRPCHMGTHRPELNAGRGFAASIGWAPKYGLSCCRECGRSDRKHSADGLCFACYSKKRFHDTRSRRVYDNSKRRYILLPKRSA